ncbi:hypothetical protein MXD61_20815 [Frankia sp. AgPm24]|uniref:hypothetical protein n=1 Tax=Frankia sp. AgPm24 TaxID=631128 RepID=UPI00200C51E1|nr:hypothetical protein [Frankia sp. AgPm24]MCK9924279.1 hypothetical protein [Frankia sp. AgPm24]
MADIVLDYGLLHELSGSLRTLRGQIQTDVDHVSGRAVVSSTGEVGADAVGDSTLFAALSAFYATCHQPFKDSMTKLDDLADLLDSVAKAFFDQDADFASKANSARLQSKIDQWQAQENAWQHYQDTKNKVITYQYYDENGVLQTATIPLWGEGRPPPTDPGARPTSVSVPDGTTTSSSQQVDGNGKIISETSTVTAPNGLSYTETTTYSYTDLDNDGKPDNVDYTTTVTHSDGTREVITKKTGTDHVSVMTSTTDDGTTTTTVTPGQNGAYNSVTVDPKGETTTTSVTVGSDGTGTKIVANPDGSMDFYNGDPAKDRWTLTSHVDPLPDLYGYPPVF